MKKITIVSRFLKWGAIAFIIAMPLLEAGYWITNGYAFLPDHFFKPAGLPAFGDMPIGWADLSSQQKLLAFLSNLIPLSFVMVAMGYIAKLFHAFEHLQLFIPNNALILKKAGWALVWSQIVDVLHTGLLSLILTFQNPVGHRNISIAMGSHQMAMLIVGVIVLLISWLLSEAARMQEEMEATV